MGRQRSKPLTSVPSSSNRKTHLPRDTNGDTTRVIRRSGHLKPDQRQKAREVRKIGACLRCRILKKSCDRHDPCGECHPAKRLKWQLPCTRLNIWDLEYLLKDVDFDHGLGVDRAGLDRRCLGVPDAQRILRITHGYGCTLEVKERVYTGGGRRGRHDKVERVETNHVPPGAHTVARIAAEPEDLSDTNLLDYVDQHIKGSGMMETFIDDYFGGTPFLTPLLRLSHHYFVETRSEDVLNGFRLLLAYSFSHHNFTIGTADGQRPLETDVNGLGSGLFHKTLPSGAIYSQMEQAMTSLWHQCHTCVLLRLSKLFKDAFRVGRDESRQGNFRATVFILTSVLLIVWDCMHFDVHFYAHNRKSAEDFGREIQSTPVQVLVEVSGLLSRTIPSSREGDERVDRSSSGSTGGVCTIMDDVHDLVTAHGDYLKGREDAHFDRTDLHSLANKFLARLVVEAI